MFGLNFLKQKKNKYIKIHFVKKIWLKTKKLKKFKVYNREAKKIIFFNNYKNFQKARESTFQTLIDLCTKLKKVKTSLFKLNILTKISLVSE